MRIRRLTLVLAVLGGAGLGGSALAHPGGKVVHVPEGTYRQVTAQALRAQLASKDFTLINVHVPYGGEIAGTDRFLPFDRVADNSTLPGDKRAELVVYCRSGAMSRVAAEALVRLGYTNVRELSGGMNAWTAAGYVLSRRPAETGGRVGAATTTSTPSTPGRGEQR